MVIMGTQGGTLTQEDSGTSLSVEQVMLLIPGKAAPVRWPTTSNQCRASRVCTLAKCRGVLLGMEY